MSKCDNCGFENDEDARICKRCHYMIRQSYENDADYINTADNDDSMDISYDNPVEKREDIPKNTYAYDDGYYLLDNVQSVFEEDNLNNQSKKSVMLGCLLSFFITGIGNVYAGLTKRGIVEFILSLVINSFIPITPDFLVDFNSYILYMALIWEVYVIYDTYRCIKAINTNREIPFFLGFIDLK